jgi:hypothetical protein
MAVFQARLTTVRHQQHHGGQPTDHGSQPTSTFRLPQASRHKCGMAPGVPATSQISRPQTAQQTDGQAGWGHAGSPGAAASPAAEPLLLPVGPRRLTLLLLPQKRQAPVKPPALPSPQPPPALTRPAKPAALRNPGWRRQPRRPAQAGPPTGPPAPRSRPALARRPPGQQRKPGLKPGQTQPLEWALGLRFRLLLVDTAGAGAAGLSVQGLHNTQVLHSHTLRRSQEKQPPRAHFNGQSWHDLCWMGP